MNKIFQVHVMSSICTAKNVMEMFRKQFGEKI